MYYESLMCLIEITLSTIERKDLNVKFNSNPFSYNLWMPVITKIINMSFELISWSTATVKYNYREVHMPIQRESEIDSPCIYAGAYRLMQAL